MDIECEKALLSCSLIVFFQEPFWVGIFEKVQDGELSVCKVTFGMEPKDYEVHQFILKNYYKLRFSPTIETTSCEELRINPKRLQRRLKRQMLDTGIGTKAQQALKLQHEHLKTQRKVNCRQKREEEQRRLYELKQHKRREKHKGR